MERINGIDIGSFSLPKEEVFEIFSKFGDKAWGIIENPGLYLKKALIPIFVSIYLASCSNSELDKLGDVTSSLEDDTGGLEVPDYCSKYIRI